VVKDEVFMRPIFSGGTAGSNLDHEIAFWIGKNGFMNELSTDLKIEGAELPDDPDQEIVLTTAAPVPAPTAAPLVPAPAPAAPAPTAAPAPVPVAPVPVALAPIAPVPAPAPVAPARYICDLCGTGQALVNLTASVFIPVNNILTCGFIADAATNGLISREVCPQLAQFLVPCGCPALPTPGPVPPSIATKDDLDDQTNALQMKIDELGMQLETKIDELEAELKRKIRRNGLLISAIHAMNSGNNDDDEIVKGKAGKKGKNREAWLN
jgi:hypothetical protein